MLSLFVAPPALVIGLWAAQLRVPPEEIRDFRPTTNPRAASALPGSVAYPCHYSEVVREPGGSPEARGLETYQKFLFVKYRVEGIGYPLVHYPPLRTGDLVPVFGFLYRANAQSGLRLTWVPDAEAPPDARLHGPTVIVPLHPGGPKYTAHTGLNRAHVWVERVDVPPEGKGMPSAQMAVDVYGTLAGGGTATVRVGDVLVTGPVGHTVRSIVPRDTKSRAIGWVELDARPILADQLGKDGSRVVRPARR